MQIVNGYPCQTCSDVALAKKDIDPANPTGDPNKAQSASKADVFDKSAQPGQSNSPDVIGSNFNTRAAVTFGGVLASSGTQSPDFAAGQNQTYSAGSVLSVSV
jgi:hypothetical protein